MFPWLPESELPVLTVEYRKCAEDHEPGVSRYRPNQGYFETGELCHIWIAAFRQLRRIVNPTTPHLRTNRNLKNIGF